MKNIVLATLSAGCILAVIAACSATTKEKPILKDHKCFLIPPDICAQLKPMSGSDFAGLRYKAEGVDWTQYKKLLIPPVVVMGDEVPRTTGDQQHALVSYLYTSLVKAFETKSELAEQPGPGVLRFQAALTDASASTPILRSVSMGIPQARLIATLKYA